PLATERAMVRQDAGEFFYLLARAALPAVGPADVSVLDWAVVRGAAWGRAFGPDWFDAVAVARAARIARALALNDQALAYYPADAVPRAVLLQRARCLHSLGRDLETAAVEARAEHI